MTNTRKALEAVANNLQSCIDFDKDEAPRLRRCMDKIVVKSIATIRAAIERDVMTDSEGGPKKRPAGWLGTSGYQTIVDEEARRDSAGDGAGQHCAGCGGIIRAAHGRCCDTECPGIPQADAGAGEAVGRDYLAELVSVIRLHVHSREHGVEEMERCTRKVCKALMRYLIARQPTPEERGEG